MTPPHCSRYGTERGVPRIKRVYPYAEPESLPLHG
jgi:hypothetical protein